MSGYWSATNSCLRLVWYWRLCETHSLPVAPKMRPAPGQPMTLDHRRILPTAIVGLRGKIKYRPVIFELMPASFTLLDLQRTVEASVRRATAQAEFPPPRRDARSR